MSFDQLEGKLWSNCA